MKSSASDIPDKRKASAAGVPWRVALVSSVPALAAILLLEWAAGVWIDGALATLPDAQAQAERDLPIAAVGLAIVFVLSMLLVGRIVARRATAPIGALGLAAERVAAGDLTIELGAAPGEEQVNRLHRALADMIAALRRLVHAMRAAADETATMSAQITAGTEELSATASEFARTAGELSQEASRMSSAIAQSASDADGLMLVVARLDAGARDGIARNDALAALARSSRMRLDESASAIAALASVAESSASSAEGVSAAAREIGAFVVLVRRIARRAKLLSLNASMEAARAGEQGEGFGVVASEMRALATTAAEAAERTEAAVGVVLERVELARENSRETVITLGMVQHAQTEAHGSFTGIERALDESAEWLKTIGDSATQSNALLAHSATRLTELAHGTESFAAAMQQVAAGSEQQSAGAEEIAAASTALAIASQALQARVSAFRVDQAES